jgi:UDP:flavonoid glycosyltransferase YjiC (YdhE family)
MSRILFTACPMHGHVNPVLSLALAAQRAGHDVVVTTGPDLVPHVEQHGVAAWPVGPTHLEAGGGADADWLEYFAASADMRSDDLVPRAAQWSPDLLVADETDLAGPVAAAVTGARLVIHGLGIMPPPQIWDAYTEALRLLFERWRLPLTADTIRAATYLEVCPPKLRLYAERAWPNAMPLRPSVPQPRPDERLSESFDALPYADTVHLTLGTVFHDNRHVLQTALYGLSDLPVNIVVATGPGVDPGTFGRQPANVLIETYLPYPLLLPKCRLVVSQGGFGVMVAGLSQGAPQLVMPQGADQFRNGMACRDAGAGLVLEPEAVTAGTVAEAVTRLLTDPAFTAAAQAVQADIEAMPGAEAVLAVLTDTNEWSAWSSQLDLLI